MKIKLVTLSFALVLAFVLSANTKTVEIKGKVTGFDKYPLQNVSVSSNKSDAEILTNENGEFSFSCAENATIKFKAQGFYTKKMKLKDFVENNSVHIDLEFKAGKKNIQLAVDNSHISKEQLALGIEFLKNEDFSKYKDMAQVLTNKLAGLRVGNSSVIINRSTGPALLVVDDRIVDFVSFSNINTDQIKSIRTMDRFEATGHYGDIANGGAILVETEANLKFAEKN
ncbi:carboxypeptidase-like regulatory domain-containing protein [Draconibacterium sediminis]|uniref:carboxypeptidase-like regulatory domain-containing protein n=1 Tax=Draconibacterium sediminis TaxID=1544798 RepID=UPI0026F2AC4B|nr:carboxypeptidase-like regulatory domain-containing protein [Draconibacterium sediminis]